MGPNLLAFEIRDNTDEVEPKMVDLRVEETQDQNTSSNQRDKLIVEGWGPNSNYKPGGGGIEFMKEQLRKRKELQEQKKQRTNNKSQLASDLMVNRQASDLD